MSFDSKRIVSYMNSYRKSTLLLFVLEETSSKLEHFEMTEMNEHYFEINFKLEQGKNKAFRRHFKKTLHDSNDARLELVALHEKRLFISWPNIVPGFLASLLWLPLPLSFQSFQDTLPYLFQNFIPSPHVSLIGVCLIGFIHFLEAMVVVNVLSRMKVSVGTIFIWFIFTMIFGYLQTEKAMFLSKVHSKGHKEQ